ncbi:MAG: prepilin-type N-terminal cleavage/methylation domain-containing protein, partial [Candidatus Omnitrophica bacterium]|nr:prepilin-type N-terminal cleavage/methylation domain-containing protein [Candidatus Omnitrophota bacterium]
MKKLRRGMSLPEIFFAIAIFAIALAVAVPSFMKMAERTRAQKCINNLRQIQIAKEQWALNK